MFASLKRHDFLKNKKESLGKTSLFSASMHSIELSGPPGSSLRTWKKQRGLWLRSLEVHVSFPSYRKEGLNLPKINVSRRMDNFPQKHLTTSPSSYFTLLNALPLAASP